MNMDGGIDNLFIDLKLPGAECHFYKNFLSKDLADFYFETFELLPFTQGRVRMGLERRLTCFYSDLTNVDGTPREYYYAGKMNTPLQFSDELRTLKETIEAVTGYQFNSCLVNLYRNGRDVIGMHSDSEESLVQRSAIASISLGAERWFDIRAKDHASDPDREESVRVKHGSLIIMAGSMQHNYKHAIRQEARVKEPRINLTFRLSK
jgi:alkylated DNA repair dioxygenase AlkB